MNASRLSAVRPIALSPLVAVLALVGACSDDGPSAPPPVLIGSEGASTMSGDDVVGSGGAGSGDTVPPEVRPGRDDRPGLTVRFPGDRSPDTLSSPWLAIVDAFQFAPFPERTGDIRVALSRYVDGFAFRDHADFFTPELDACDIRFPERPGGEDEGEGDGPASVRGGDAVTLSSAGAPWASVPFSPELEAYDGDDVFPGAAPDDLTLSLPGEAFPAIDALPLFVPNAPERLSPNFDEPVTAATEYRWVPADDGAFVQVVFVRAVDGEIADFPIICDVVDDGAFELPGDAVATLVALAELPGVVTVRYARRLERLDFRDGVAVLQTFTLADD